MEGENRRHLPHISWIIVESSNTTIPGVSQTTSIRKQQILPRKLTAGTWKLMVETNRNILLQWSIFRWTMLGLLGVYMEIMKMVPPKSSIFNRLFHYFHHPFWGTPLNGRLSALRPRYGEQTVPVAIKIKDRCRKWGKFAARAKHDFFLEDPTVSTGVRL